MLACYSDPVMWCPPANRTGPGVRPPGMLRRLLLLTLLAVTGCAAAGPPLTVASPPPPPDPAQLIGWWRLAGTEEVVLLDPAAIEVLDGPRTLTGTWLADSGGRLVVYIDSASVTGSPEPAPGAPQATSPWLAEVGGFRTEGADRVLLDRAGAEVGRLVPEPPVPGSGAVDPARPIGDAERPRFTPAAPVPPPLAPAGEPDLLGRWTPAGSSIGAWFQLDPGGAWTGSDGCNGAGGTWLAGPDGGFLAGASAFSTLIACDGPAGDPPVDVGAQLGATRRVALGGAELVLLDASGAEIGRYQRG